jgi:uncharacterized membrane protein YcaP (DUF421 family)
MQLSDMQQLIGPDSAERILWWQMCVRAVLVFVFGIALVRLSGKRTFGKLSALDIVLAIIVGSNMSRALTAAAPFWSTLAATALLALLHFALARLSIHLRWLGPLIKGRPRRLITDGRIDKDAMRRGQLSHGDLDEELRLHGLEGPESVKAAYLERNGSVSVIKR